MTRYIPVFSLVARSYIFTLVGAKSLIISTWPWIGLSYVVGWLSKPTEFISVDGELPLGIWISLLTNLVASSAISVLCHRAVVLGQWPSGLRSLHFGQQEVYYLLALLGFGFTVASITIIFTILTNILGFKSRWNIFILAFIVMILYARVSMILPDLAVAKQRLPWWYIWRISYGQTARITLGIVMSSAPLALIVQQLTVIEVILYSSGLTWIAILVEFLGMLTAFLAIINSAAFLAFTYKVLLSNNRGELHS